MARAPFTDYQTTIKPAWIDYNNHLNDAAYALVLAEANEIFLATLDLSEDYRKQSGASLYTVDLHITYRAEVKGSDTLVAESVITELTPKKLRLETKLIRSDQTIAAIGTNLYLHYDTNVSAVTPMPDKQFELAKAWLRDEQISES